MAEPGGHLLGATRLAILLSSAMWQYCKHSTVRQTQMIRTPLCDSVFSHATSGKNPDSDSNSSCQGIATQPQMIQTCDLVFSHETSTKNGSFDSRPSLLCRGAQCGASGADAAEHAAVQVPTRDRHHAQGRSHQQSGVCRGACFALRSTLPKRMPYFV